MIYVHVPFCRSFCTYCDFYSEVATKCRNAEDAVRQESDFERYADALAAEIRERKNEIQETCAGNGVSTLYIGGGTPSVLPLGVFRRMLDALKEIGVSGEFTEFTVEVNPEDVVDKGEDYVKGLLELGVNRFSMGVQSFDDGILKWMNRRHDSATAVKAYGILESAGVRNISIDLIFGLPQISDELWRETLKQALDISSSGIPPKHISSYQLSVEPGSMLAKMVDKGMWSEASDELCERQYRILCEELDKAGYHHYEISNFAQPGYEAVHNSAYWRHVPYVGLGPGAHSCLAEAYRGSAPESMLQKGGCNVSGNIIRQWNIDDLRGYINAAQNGDFAAVRDGEVLDAGQIVIERVMLGLRTSVGLPEDVLMECCGAGAVDAAMACGDLVRCPGGNIRIPESRFFVSDRIISDIV